MLDTIMTAAICTTAICAIGASWDAARRYIEMRRFNQSVLDAQARIDQEHEALKTKVQAIGDKLTAQTHGSVSRLGGRVQR